VGGGDAPSSDGEATAEANPVAPKPVQNDELKRLRFSHHRTALDVDIDSLDMQPKDRAIIVAACQNAPEERLIITHGTDTMVETAKDLAKANIAKIAIPISQCKTMAVFVY
jgi:L-asparaginase/Glu-tRNA(Gln) amidotransferase subunit D